jgi:hypothetical protein
MPLKKKRLSDKKCKELYGKTNRQLYKELAGLNPYPEWANKTAAPRWIKEVKAGRMSIEQAGLMGKKLKQIRHLRKTLGKGAEGLAELVTHPGSPNGLAAQKVYDPNGRLFGDRLLEFKIRVGKLFKNDPNFAKYLGRRKDSPVVYYEYVPDTSAIPSVVVEARKKSRIGENLTRIGDKLDEHGMSQIKDIYPRNVGLSSPEAQPKILDLGFH